MEITVVSGQIADSYLHRLKIGKNISCQSLDRLIGKSLLRHKGWRLDQICDICGYWCLASPLLSHVQVATPADVFVNDIQTSIRYEGRLRSSLSIAYNHRPLPSAMKPIAFVLLAVYTWLMPAAVLFFSLRGSIGDRLRMLLCRKLKDGLPHARRSRSPNMKGSIQLQNTSLLFKRKY